MFAIRSSFSRSHCCSLFKNSQRLISWRSLRSEPNMRTYVIAAVLGMGAGTAYAFKIFKSENNLASKLNYVANNKDVAEVLSKRVEFGQKVDFPLQLTLFECHGCLFCSKVRAYLRYYGIDYNSVEVNCATRRQIKWSKYKVLPIVFVRDGNLQLNDSNVIISALHTVNNNPEITIQSVLPIFIPEIVKRWPTTAYRYSNSYRILGVDFDGNETKWRRWVDEQLIPIVYVTINKTLKQSLASLRVFAKDGEWKDNFGSFWSNVMVYAGAVYMYFKNHRKREVYGQTIDTAIKQWTDELKENKFNGGEKPNLADLSAYGVLSSVQDCISFTQICSKNNKFATWWESMQRLVESNAGVNKPDEVVIEKLVEDTLPPMITVLLTFTAAKFLELALVAANSV